MSSPYRYIAEGDWLRGTTLSHVAFFDGSEWQTACGKVIATPYCESRVVIADTPICAKCLQAYGPFVRSHPRVSDQGKRNQKTEDYFESAEEG